MAEPRHNHGSKARPQYRPQADSDAHYLQHTRVRVRPCPISEGMGRRGQRTDCDCLCETLSTETREIPSVLALRFHLPIYRWPTSLYLSFIFALARPRTQTHAHTHDTALSADSQCWAGPLRGGDRRRA